MLRFRSDPRPVPADPTDSPSADTVRRLAALTLAPAHFFAPSGVLTTEHVPDREQRWEVFRGRLLDPAHTRQTARFEEWNLTLSAGDEGVPAPILSLKFDVAGGKLHVVRSLLCHVHEGYDAGGGVILTRETTRRTQELIGTITLAEFPRADDLLDELTCLVFQAVVGSSRLPLTSVEAPLPEFSLGRLAYCFDPKILSGWDRRLAGPDRRDAGPTGTGRRHWRELLAAGRLPLGATERAKWLETLLHATPREETDALAANLPEDSTALLLRMFNEVSLSPWTELTERALGLLAALERQGRITEARAADVLASLLLQTTRHLTAYDLITFHHRGANYPDALLLDAVLKDFLRRIEKSPALFSGDVSAPRRRRRALRQAWMVRRFYEGLPVPDSPTSPGENARVLPGLPRVPEDQILQPSRRHRLLYDGDPLPRHLGPAGEDILVRSLHDLADPAELSELGVALFLDRPFGAGKRPGEPDGTLLLSHRAFSSSVARTRLRFLSGQLRLIDDASTPESRLAELTVSGIPLAEIGGRPRPGTVSIADARQVAPDFVFLETTRSTVGELFREYDFEPLLRQDAFRDLRENRGLLLVPLAGEETLTLYDSAGKARLRLTPDASRGTVRRAGRELLRAGLIAERLDGVMPRVVLEPALG